VLGGAQHIDTTGSDDQQRHPAVAREPSPAHPAYAPAYPGKPLLVT